MKTNLEILCSKLLKHSEKTCADPLQGWLKAVNSNILDPEKDMGNDGDDVSINSNVAKDAFGFTLNYYAGDYSAIDLNKWNTASTRFEAYTAGSDLFAARNDLYNGNISAMVTSITEPGTPDAYPLGTAYKYDQLNRLIEMQAYENINPANNAWQQGSVYGGMFHNTFTYDANGNIKTLTRADHAGNIFDDFTYNYLTNNNELMQNRLYHINDSAISGLSTNEDISDPGYAFTNGVDYANYDNNYAYDEIGNLKKDSVEGIAQIEWTVSGKVKSITRHDGFSKTINSVTIYPSDLEFLYDATGNRIAKIEKTRDINGLKPETDWKTTYYVRDAQGNEMAIYKLFTESSLTHFQLSDNPIFGSSRIGLDYANIELISPPPQGVVYSNILGLKQFELTNHIDNVLSTITDVKLQVSFSGTTVDFYAPHIIGSQHYFPYGMLLPYSFPADEMFRFGAGRQEKDNEITGINGSHYTAMFWEYDARTGRRWNLDPVFVASESRYICFSDNPILYNDINGDFRTKFGAWLYSVVHGGKIEQDKGGEWYVGKPLIDYKIGGAAYQRRFDWSGRNKGKDLAFEDVKKAWKTQNDFAQTLSECGIKYSYEDKETARMSMIQLSTIGLLPNPILKGGTTLINASTEATRATNNATHGFFKGTKYSNKVLEQMKNGDFHAFPESVTAFEKNGIISSIKGGDGVTRKILKIPGGYGEKKGFFEFIKETDGTINHRLFRPTLSK